MISLELSTIQHNREQSSRIAAAIAEFESKGGVIQRFETTVFTPPPFNNEQPAPSAKQSKALTIKRSQKALDHELALAEKLRAYKDTSFAHASKELGISKRRLHHIAAEYGIEFASVKAGSNPDKMAEHDEKHLPAIIEMLSRHMSHTAIAESIGITRNVLRRMFRTHSIGGSTKTSTAVEKKLIERIKAIRDIGCTRSACCLQLNISHVKLNQLLEDWEVEYPARVTK